jgi:hypothetical protein
MEKKRPKGTAMFASLKAKFTAFSKSLDISNELKQLTRERDLLILFGNGGPTACAKVAKLQEAIDNVHLAV